MGDIYSIDRSSRKQLIHAVYTSTLLSLLFIAVYGGSSWITDQRSTVGTLYLDWEQYIPFIPILILPYMSIDLFYVGAPFIIKSREERLLFAKRIAFSIIVAGMFFLVFPLQFAFPRQTPDGWLAPIYNFLHGFDRPYNLFPSLHITLRTILADTYTHHTKGSVKWMTHIWFSLIGFSTIFTLQHHVLDVLGGFILAIFCFYFFRSSNKQPITTNKKIGSYYLVGSLLFGLLAFLESPWGVLFLWPAIALFLAAISYFGLLSQPYRKEFGLLPLSAKWLMAPCIVGQYLSLFYYKRQTRPWDEVIPGLLIGRKLHNKEAKDAIQQGVTAVVDLTSEFSGTKLFVEDTHYLNIPTLDLTAPTQRQLKQSVDFISQQKMTGTVYVHCKIGYSRSATVIGSYLIASGVVQSADEALQLMRDSRPGIIVRPEAMESLNEFERSYKSFP